MPYDPLRFIPYLFLDSVVPTPELYEKIYLNKTHQTVKNKKKTFLKTERRKETLLHWDMDSLFPNYHTTFICTMNCGPPTWLSKIISSENAHLLGTINLFTFQILQ
jgi:hypothetical protein